MDTPDNNIPDEQASGDKGRPSTDLPRSVRLLKYFNEINLAKGTSYVNEGPGHSYLDAILLKSDSPKDPPQRG